MLVTAFGIVTDVKAEQPLKALLLMLMTESGIVTDVTAALPEKALSLILLTVRVQLVPSVIDAGILILPLTAVLLATATVVGEVTI